jgi:hypothetical protein
MSNKLCAPDPTGAKGFTDELEFEVRDGTILAFSDCHFDVEAPPSSAHRAVVMLAAELQPQAIVCGGDSLDLAALSKHPRIGWERRSRPADEITYGQARLAEIEQAAPNAALFHCLGNHDVRIGSWCSNHAEVLEGLPGLSIENWFPEWSFCWRLTTNPAAHIPTVFKHRGAGNGATAASRNVARCGTNVITSHTHHLQAIPYTDWRSTRWGVDTGCTADVNGRLFANYTEKSVTGWRSGAVVLSFAAGELLVPEIILVVKESPVPGEGLVSFRGRLWEV